MHVKTTYAVLVAVASATPVTQTTEATTEYPHIPKVTGPPVLSVSADRLARRWNHPQPGWCIADNDVWTSCSWSPERSSEHSKYTEFMTPRSLSTLMPSPLIIRCPDYCLPADGVQTPCSPEQWSSVLADWGLGLTTFKTEVSEARITGYVLIKGKVVGGEETKLDDKWNKASSPHYVVHD
jgi:hypothetical protein